MKVLIRWTFVPFVLFAGVGVLVGARSVSLAQNEPEVGPQPTAMSVGEVKQVEVRVSGLALDQQDANAFDVKLRFDSAIVDIEEMAPGPLWTAVAGVTEIQNGDGWVRMVAWRITTGNASDACGNPCLLFTLSIRGQADGFTMLELAEGQDPGALLADSASYVPTRWRSAEIRVGDGPTQTGEPTSLATPATSQPTTPSPSPTPTPTLSPAVTVTETPKASATAPPTQGPGLKFLAWVGLVSRD